MSIIEAVGCYWSPLSSLINNYKQEKYGWSHKLALTTCNRVSIAKDLDSKCYNPKKVIHIWYNLKIAIHIWYNPKIDIHIWYNHKKVIYIWYTQKTKLTFSNGSDRER